MGLPNLGVGGTFSAHPVFFQISYHFSMIFIKNFKNSILIFQYFLGQVVTLCLSLKFPPTF